MSRLPNTVAERNIHDADRRDIRVTAANARQELDDLEAIFEDATAKRPAFARLVNRTAGRESLRSLRQLLRDIERAAEGR